MSPLLLVPPKENKTTDELILEIDDALSRLETAKKKLIKNRSKRKHADEVK